MYLREIFLQNTGPISECRVKPPFDDVENPLPVVVVGPNGSGKTIFLSYIVDALTEFAKTVFIDIVDSGNLDVIPYFRVIQPGGISSGAPFSLSLLHFKATGNDLHYCEKVGTLDASSYSSEPDLKSVFAPVWNWPTAENHKNISINENTVESEMINGAYGFFPASRHEDPIWLNLESLKTHLTASSARFEKQLDKPLWVETCAKQNISWVLDVFLDSLIDLLPRLQLAQDQNLIYRNVNTSELTDLRNRAILRQARQNVERILQAILQDRTAQLILNLRNTGPSRISVKMGDGRIIL